MSQTLSNSIKIIKAELEHFDLAASLFDAYRVFYEQPSDLAGAREFIRARMENNESVIYLAVTEEDKRLVPLGFTQLYPSFASVSMKKVWILYDLFVVTEVRRQGVGTALIEKAWQLAEETEATGLILETAIDNEPAQAFYEAVGFEREEEFYTYYLMVDED